MRAEVRVRDECEYAVRTDAYIHEVMQIYARIYSCMQWMYTSNEGATIFSVEHIHARTHKVETHTRAANSYLLYRLFERGRRVPISSFFVLNLEEMLIAHSVRMSVARRTHVSKWCESVGKVSECKNGALYVERVCGRSLRASGQ